jgi:hypothetical protein
MRELYMGPHDDSFSLLFCLANPTLRKKSTLLSLSFVFSFLPLLHLAKFILFFLVAKSSFGIVRLLLVRHYVGLEPLVHKPSG